jgi:chromosomal replication initiator protein
VTPSAVPDPAPAPAGSPAEAACVAVQDRARRDLPPPAQELWFADLAAGAHKGDVVELLAPSAYVRSWLAGHYMDLITAAAREVLGPRTTVRLRVAPAPPGAAARTAAGGPAAASARVEQPTLDQALAASPFPHLYTFETFVPGPSNKFAHAAALAVAEAPPSKAYNPLFIYGGVGLGKTHLLFAVANHMWRLSPRTRCRYVTSETFVSEFIKSVRDGRGYQFAKQYRDVDVLLFDDVQFLAQKEETQNELFHTFNHLYHHERQVVFASDRPPHELSIAERLRSRFASGLVADVQPPDFETRIAILQTKALRDRLSVPDDVLHYIASKFGENIRQLEGALLRVAAFASLNGQPADLTLAQRTLEDLIPESSQDIPAMLILNETAAYFGLTPADLISKSRSRQLTTARHVAMYLLRELTGLSLIKIGEMFDRDHTTALHGIKKIEALLSARGSIYRQVQELTKKIRVRSAESRR